MGSKEKNALIGLYNVMTVNLGGFVSSQKAFCLSCTTNTTRLNLRACPSSAHPSTWSPASGRPSNLPEYHIPISLSTIYTRECDGGGDGGSRPGSSRRTRDVYEGPKRFLSVVFAFLLNIFN